MHKGLLFVPRFICLGIGFHKLITRQSMNTNTWKILTYFANWIFKKISTLMQAGPQTTSLPPALAQVWVLETTALINRQQIPITARVFAVSTKGSNGRLVSFTYFFRLARITWRKPGLKTNQIKQKANLNEQTRNPNKITKLDMQNASKHPVTAKQAMVCWRATLLCSTLRRPLCQAQGRCYRGHWLWQKSSLLPHLLITLPALTPNILPIR